MPRSTPPDRFHDLIEAATAVFLEQGFRRTQMSDVADRMGVAKGTLYLYVESKEALFHAVIRHADRPERVALPETLPVPTPSPGETLEEVRKRVADGQLPRLAEALARRRVTDARAELEAILRELWSVLAHHRIGIKLLDRCAHDHPDLAAVWYSAGREGALALLRAYLEDRIRRGRLAPVSDVAITARTVLETIVFWTVHRHWDPSPQPVTGDAAETAVVSLLLRALSPS